MCYNCEGEVDLDVIVCPFCAADLREEKPELQHSTYNPAVSVKNLGTQQSLYPPQFVPKSVEAAEEAVAADPPIAEESGHEEKGIIGPTILVTLGVQLLLFGLFMGLFSTKGVMILKWDARLWYFYVLSSIPLLVFGYKAVSKL